MSADQKVETEREPRKPKKPYEPPRLTEYGSVVDLTQGGGVPGVSDNLLASIL